MRRIAAFFLTLLFPAVLPAARGVFREYPLPTAGAQPTSITFSVFGDVWFTEFAANKIGRISPGGELTEYAIPTPGSGPSGITTFEREAWFTEFNTNKIGRISPEGVITEYSIPTPASGPFGITSEIADDAIWFTEFNGNKLGRISRAGAITEFPIPTADSGPMGISPGPDGAIWFTEFRGNKIGSMFREGGTVREIPVPTPGSGPTGITGTSGRVWFTEFNGNKIGRITQANGTLLEEFPVPTAMSGPSGIDADGEIVWFTERHAGRIALIDPSGAVSEYPIPAVGSDPGEIVAAHLYVFFTERGTGKVGRMIRDALVVVGAGVSGSWDTEYRFGNPNPVPTSVSIGVFFEPNTVCSVNCPVDTSGLTLPARGTGSLRASEAAVLLRSLRPVYVRSDPESPATVTARVFNTARPTQGIEIPTIRLSTLWNLNPSVLAFPGAKRGLSVHSNLVLDEVGWDEEITILVEAFSAFGAALGSAQFRVEPGGTLFLVDALSQLGVAELDGGQIRVTRIGGGGLMWGFLATLTDDGGITVSPGLNP